MARRLKLLVVAMIPFVMHTEASEVPTIVNIVNFVRGTEPRYPDRDLLEPVKNEIELNTSNNLPNTFLLQYDALLRDDMVETVKTADKSLTEYGVWFEMCRQLVEKCGIEWRGRKGWDWDRTSSWRPVRNSWREVRRRGKARWRRVRLPNRFLQEPMDLSRYLQRVRQGWTAS